MYLWFKFDYTCNILKKIIFETVVILRYERWTGLTKGRRIKRWTLYAKYMIGA